MSPRLHDPDRAKGPSSPHGLFHGAGKWVTALITTAAALAALLVNAQNLGLGAWLGAHGLGFADYAAHRVAVTPRVDTLFAIGDTLMLSATVTDRRGAALVGSSLSWRSEDPSVATADSDGTVVGHGPGSTRVVATVRGLSAAARITVSQRVVQVAISGDSLIPVPEGESVPLLASALDARGFRIRDVTPRWTSSDSTVATVDSAGVLTGHVPGHAVLSAALDGHVARARVDVLLWPGSLLLESGDAQRVPAGRRVPQPIIVLVASRGGRPVPHVPVIFQAEDPDASLAPAVDTTNRQGRAHTIWTLSPRPGRQRLAATVEGVDSALVVVVEADPVARNTRVTLAGEPPVGRVGRPLVQPVVVRVTDSLGVTLADIPVRWAAPEGGRLEPLADRTDSAGEARVRWTLGPKAGPQRAQVRVGNPRTMFPFVVTALAAAGEPQAVALLSGAGQRGPAGGQLRQDVVLAVIDQFGNPVAGVAVQARPRDGAVADTLLLTDSTGTVAVRWTLGRRAGTDLLRLRARGVDSLVNVVARAEPLSASNLAFVKPPEIAAPDRPLALTVAVTDAYGNPVPDVPVSFSTSAGALSVRRATSDATGQAATRWTPAAAPSQQAVTAVVRSGAATARHTVRVSAPAPKVRAP